MRKYKDFILIGFTIAFTMLFDAVLTMVNPLSYPNITVFYHLPIFWGGLVVLIAISVFLGIQVYKQAQPEADAISKIASSAISLADSVTTLNSRLQKLDKLDGLVDRLDKVIGKMEQSNGITTVKPKHTKQ